MLDLVNSLAGGCKVNRRTMLSVGSICLGGLSLPQLFQMQARAGQVEKKNRVSGLLRTKKNLEFAEYGKYLAFLDPSSSRIMSHSSSPTDSKKGTGFCNAMRHRA